MWRVKSRVPCMRRFFFLRAGLLELELELELELFLYVFGIPFVFNYCLLSLLYQIVHMLVLHQVLVALVTYMHACRCDACKAVLV